MKYIIKATEIEAFQYGGDLKGAPEWVLKALDEGRMFFDGEPVMGLHIKEPDGAITVCMKDYIVKKENDLYCFSPSVFQVLCECTQNKCPFCGAIIKETSR